MGCFITKSESQKELIFNFNCEYDDRPKKLSLFEPLKLHSETKSVIKLYQTDLSVMGFLNIHD